MEHRLCMFTLALVLLLSLVVVPATAVTIVKNAGDGQSATVGTAVTTPPSVLIKDAMNNPVSGQSVTFDVTTGGGSVTSTSVTTGGDGIASAGGWTLGTSAGSNTLTATAGGSSVTFTATGTAGPAAQMAANAGNGQSVTAGSAVTTLPSVLVTDSNNNPVSGVNVIFAVTSGGGSASGLSVSTGANGVATVGSWTLGSSAGTNTLTATSGTLTGSPVTFTATGTAAANPAPTITSVSPASGYNTSSVSSVIIAGTGFSTSGGSVVLAQSGLDNITATIDSASATQLTCTFPITGKQSGSWNVIVTNADGQSVTRTGGFTILSSSNAATLSSIDPSSAFTNTTPSITLTGTNFQTSATIRLRRSGYNDIPGNVSTRTSTQITGNFTLTNKIPGDYQVCVFNPNMDPVCALTFKVEAPSAIVNGSIFFETNPSGASVYVNNTYRGTTSLTLSNLAPGYYKIMMQKSGYQTYTETVHVTAGNKATVYQKLVSSETVTQTTATTVATTITTVKTTKKPTTAPVPTSWPTPTPASPTGPLVILGGVGLAIVLLRKH